MNKFKRYIVALCLAVTGVLNCTGALATETVTFFHNDIAGTPMLATDSAGNVVWKENYRPYGERLNKSNAAENNQLWFAGKPQDAHTGLSYMGARYYDPMLGRFMGVDPMGFDPENLHSFNRYAYANNNPYRFVDPDGHTPVDVAFLAYDLGKLGAALYSGGGVGAALIDVAMSSIGVVSPVPAVGQVLKAARVIGHVADGSKVASEAIGGVKQGATLYRAVGPAELADITKTGVLRNLGSAEGKYFTTSAVEASAYARQAVKGFGDAPYTIVKIEVPMSIFSGLSPVTVDRGITAWVIPGGRLPASAPNVMNYMPLPP